MSDFNYFEYSVEAKSEGKLKLKKLIMLTSYILVPAVFLTVVIWTGLIPLGFFTALIAVAYPFFTWRYVKPEYEYTIAKGEMTFSRVYGGKSRKDFLKVRIQDMSLIAPYNDEYKARSDEVNEKYYCVSSMSSPDVYFGLFKNEKTKKTSAVFFEATAKMVKLAKFYNGSATVESKNLRY